MEQRFRLGGLTPLPLRRHTCLFTGEIFYGKFRISRLGSAVPLWV
jgi:hypothetical protein